MQKSTQNPLKQHEIASELTPIVGLHHVTAIASDPQQNLDFYIEILGLRLVKRTVNFDDPGTYHFYFGDDSGTPGTIMTFFPWPSARRGTAGVGEVTHTAFAIPEGSISYWENHLRDKGILFENTAPRFSEQVLTLADPDGMKIELVADSKALPSNAPRYADIPAEHSIRGFFGLTLLEHTLPATQKSLEIMGFRKIAEEGNRTRFASPAGTALGNHIDVITDNNANYGHGGAGTVHHIAFRAKDDAAQLLWRQEIEKHLSVTTVLDRDYFHSIYFREPGGVLFELDTDNPGFLIDEPIETLGEALHIPHWLNGRRAQIEASLAPITMSQSSQKAGK
jgi:glyoxalase family protein